MRVALSGILIDWKGRWHAKAVMGRFLPEEIYCMIFEELCLGFESA